MLPRLVSRLPLPVLYVIAGMICILAFRIFGFRRKIVRQNIANAFPDKTPVQHKGIETGFYRHISDLLAEALKGFSMPAEDLRQRVTLHNTEVLDHYIEDGRCVIVLTAHQCNWEWAQLICCLELGYPFHAVYRPLHIKYWDREIVRMRSRFGGTLIPAKDIVGDILQRKGVVRCIGMNADQGPMTAHKSIWIRFLSQDTAFFPGAEDIARATGYPLVFMAMKKVRRGYYELHYSQLADPKDKLPQAEITRRYAAAVEKLVNERPTDWFWTHRRWKLKKPLYQT